MDSPSALIALDQGTSVTRAALYREGRLVAEVRRPVSLHFPSPGRAEQDPRELLDVAREVLELCCESLEPGERAALGIAHQRSTIVLWDADNGRPFGPALSWRDSRARAESDELAARVKDLQQRTGLPATPHYGAPKIGWALDHWPEAAAAARAGRLRIGTVGSWLLWKLSLGEAFTIDPTNAQRLLLLDLRTLDWDETLLRAARVPEGALPGLRPTDGTFGDVRIGKHLLPVRAMLGDQQAALAGLGEQRADTALVQLGTGGFVMVGTGAEARFVPGLLAGIARADANKERRYLVEGPVNSAGSALDRLRDLGILGENDDLCEVMARAANPVTLVPAWAGLAAPWWASGARAMLAGWDESTTRADIVAGTVRGIAFLVADILDFMSAAGLRIGELELSGSLSQQACVAQAIADATQRRARVRVNPEATLEGIALVLAEATGARPPALSVSDGALLEPGTDLSAARDAFATARQAATKLGRGEGEAP